MAENDLDRGIKHDRDHSLFLILRRIELKLYTVMRLQGVTNAEIDKLIAAENDEVKLKELTDQLKASSDALKASTQANQPVPSVAQPLDLPVRVGQDVKRPMSETGAKPGTKERFMANPILDVLAQQVAANVDVENSAAQLIDGFADRQQKAIDAALANGATEAELAPVQAEVDAMKAARDKLAASVVANTPAATGGPQALHGTQAPHGHKNKP